MSSFKDKLERLHSSRRRARERARADDGTGGVFRADDVDESEAPPGDTPDETEGRAGETAHSERAAPSDALRIIRHEYEPRARHGSARLDALRSAPLSELIDSFLPDRSGDPAPLAASELLFVDTETTGLGSDDYAFCIGWGWLAEEGEFRVRHAVLTDPAGEPAALRRFAERLRASSLVCTYNGANFDLPLLRRRADDCGVDADFRDSAHLDLLPVTRSVCDDLEAHRLADLEHHLLDFRREDDLPGAEVPATWQRYLDRRDFEILEPVLRHNRLDIASLCAALPELAERTGDDGAEAELSPPLDAETESSTDSRGGSDGPADGAVEEQLARSYSMRSRGRSTDDVSRETPDAPRQGGPSEKRDPSDSVDGGTEDNGLEGAPAAKSEPPNERARRLRERVEELLAAEKWSETRPLLHELVALHPRHSFGLEKLAQLHDREDNPELARHYRSRLREAAPF